MSGIIELHNVTPESNVIPSWFPVIPSYAHP